MTIDIEELRPAVEAAGLNAISTQEVLELLGRLEAAEKEREIDEERIVDLMADLNRVGQENEELRAKIVEMEKQEPVAWTTKLALYYGANALGFDACAGNLWGEKGVPLYALPGAQGEEK